jgi:hypothetical protein
LVLALALLSLASLLSGGVWRALAWNPPTDDLPETDSSSKYYPDNEPENRFDIPNATKTIHGLQVGEDFGDTDSIAFLIKLDVGKGVPHSFTVNNMEAGDQYEVYFTIGDVSFCILFRASGSSAGTATLYKQVNGSWSSQVSLPVSNIQSGTHYNTIDYRIGFTLTDATTKDYGSVKFVISKQYLYGLGARGNLVTGIYATTRSSGDGSPGWGTEMDRCPAEGSVRWTLQGDIPDLPLSALLLALPLIALYAYLRRSRSGSTYDFKANLRQLTEG